MRAGAGLLAEEGEDVAAVGAIMYSGGPPLEFPADRRVTFTTRFVFGGHYLQ